MGGTGARGEGVSGVNGIVLKEKWRDKESSSNSAMAVREVGEVGKWREDWGDIFLSPILVNTKGARAASKLGGKNS